LAAKTGKVRLPTVVRLYDGCISLSELEGRSRSLDGTLATWVKIAQFFEILTALSLPRRNRKVPLYTTELKPMQETHNLLLLHRVMMLWIWWCYRQRCRVDGVRNALPAALILYETGREIWLVLLPWRGIKLYREW